MVGVDDLFRRCSSSGREIARSVNQSMPRMGINTTAQGDVSDLDMGFPAFVLEGMM